MDPVLSKYKYPTSFRASVMEATIFFLNGALSLNLCNVQLCNWRLFRDLTQDVDVDMDDMDVGDLFS